MADQVPQWLARALPEADGADGLAIARLGSAAVLHADGFRLSSPAFDDGEELDPSFTADEDDAVAPPLEWSAPPAGAVEMALLVECPQGSASAVPACQWLVWGLAAQRGKLLEGEVPPRTGKNARGNSEWLLPDVPEGKQHGYVFQLFALDAPVALLPGATRADVLAAMDGHVIGAAVLTGTYAGNADVDEVDWDGDGD